MNYSDRLPVRVDASELNGKRIAAIDVVDDPGKEHEIQITTECGRMFRFYHSVDCCESVQIAKAKDGDGNLLTLIGKTLIDVSHATDSENDPPSEHSDSWTNTTITFRTDSETVISRWIGESNGYYSEDVDLEEIFPQE